MRLLMTLAVLQPPLHPGPLHILSVSHGCALVRALLGVVGAIAHQPDTAEFDGVLEEAENSPSPGVINGAGDTVPFHPAPASVVDDEPATRVFFSSRVSTSGFILPKAEFSRLKKELLKLLWRELVCDGTDYLRLCDLCWKLYRAEPDEVIRAFPQPTSLDDMFDDMVCSPASAAEITAAPDPRIRSCSVS